MEVYASYRRQLLSRASLFRFLTPREIDSILAFSQECRFLDGTLVFQKGDPGSCMMAVLRGSVRISAYSDEGKEVTLNMIRPGQIFGEIALLDGRPRSADAVAIGDCTLLIVQRREFIPFLKKNPKVSIGLIEVLCERVRKTSEILEDVIFFDLPRRLSRQILRLADSYGRKTSGGLRINLKLSQQELGNFIGTSRESVNKQLRAWQDQRFISMERGYITIIVREELDRIAGSSAEQSPTILIGSPVLSEAFDPGQRDDV